MKLQEQKKALKLRKAGHSLSEISSALKISKSTASLWLRDVSLSAKATKALEDKQAVARISSRVTHKAKIQQSLRGTRLQAKNIIQNVKLDREHKKILCSLLYWCEGSKSATDSSFAFTNSDPKLVETFLKLFRESFEVDEEKFRVCVHLHDYHDEQRQLQFWSKVTTIPPSNFIKPYKKQRTGKRVREGYQGCVSVRYHDTQMAREVQAIARVFMGL